MNKDLRFLSAIGTLKEKKRRGWILHGIENGETTAEHILHTAFLAWMGAQKRNDLDLEKVIKLSLIHDICEVYAPDLTSYDAVGIKEEGEITEEEIKNIVSSPQRGRPTTNQRRRMEIIKKKLEEEGIEKLLADTPEGLREEIASLWSEYEERFTAESRFVWQADRLANLFQGMEYYKKFGNFEYELWLRRAKEVLDDEYFLKLLGEIEEELEA